MKTTEIIIVRIIGFPFFFCLGLFGVIVLFTKYIINYVRYGGEAISYTHKAQRKCINDVYYKVVELIDKQNERQTD